MSVRGLGIDLVDLARMERLLARHGDRILARLLTPGERDYCAGKTRPTPHVAARVAAKEAAYKALQGAGGDARSIGWHDMEVGFNPFRQPALTLHGAAQRAADRLGVAVVHLSLTHSRSAAGAVVVVEGAGAGAATSE